MLVLRVMSSYLASSVLFFSNCAASVRFKLSDGETQVLASVQQSLKAGEVAAGHIRGTFNQMTADQRPGDMVEVLRPVPSMPPHAGYIDVSRCRSKSLV